MLKIYCKIALRNLWKNRIFAAINITGLSAGIAFALLIGAYVWGELGVNQQLRNAGNQYFLKSEWKDPNMGNEITTLGPLAKRLKEEYPQLVTDYYRWDGITSVVSRADKHLRENIQLGDSTLLAMYGLPLLHGNAASALTQPYSAVIAKATAIRYFGKTNVVGETLSIQSFSGGQHDFTVTAVLDEIPENSVTQLNNDNKNTVFIPTNTYTYFGRQDFESWSNIWVPSYIELKKGADLKTLNLAIAQLVRQHAPETIQQNLVIKPIKLTDYYLQKGNAAAKRMLYTLSAIGLFILLMAVVNFINIAISSSGSRTREIGVRKVLGGLRSQLIVQFLTESVIMVAIATGLAFICYPLAEHGFAELVGKQLPALSSFPWPFVFTPFALVLLVASLAGVYPAFVLSSLKAVDSLKGKLSTVGEKIWLRKSLVGFQFFVALVVLVGAAVIAQQVNYFFGRDLGYNKSFMVSSQVPRDWTPAGVRKMEMVRNEFARMPQVSDVTLSYEIPNGNNGGQPSVYRSGSDAEKAIPMQLLVTDEHYLSAYQIPLSSGAFFAGNGQDSGKVILNEQAVKALGYASNEAAIGQPVRIPGDSTVFTIRGVTTDFHFGSMQQSIAPLLFFNVQSAPAYRFLSFRLRPGNTAAAIGAIERKWAALLPGSSFEYRFMDDALASIYATELQLKKAAYTATALSLLIMLLGLLGLVSLSIHKRTKEIGIRKVLGAPVMGILMLFIKEFLLIIVLAAAVAVPVVTLLMKNWLNDYAYRVNLSPQLYVVAIIMLTALTVVLVTAQTIKAALTNPVKSLKTE
jgi:putative ABC transport system permease protein